MRSSFFIVCILSGVLVFGMLLAGCTQSQSSGQAQSGVNVVTTGQPTIQSGNVAITIVPTPVVATTTAPVSYNIEVTVTRQDPSTIKVTYQGGQSAAYLMQIKVLANGVVVGTLAPPSGATFLPVGTSGTFPVPVESHVVLFGHFLGGGVQSIFDHME